MTPVQSSNVAAIGHNANDSTLTVRFKNGQTFRYQNVTGKQHRELMKAESKGSWLAENIVRRPIAHPYVKLPEPKPKKK